MSALSNPQLMYASYTDEELVCQIVHETGLKNVGYHPDEPDLKKRGFNSETCNQIIADMQMELDRRKNVGRAI